MTLSKYHDQTTFDTIIQVLKDTVGGYVYFGMMMYVVTMDVLMMMMIVMVMMMIMINIFMVQVSILHSMHWRQKHILFL